ncbi:uncharacterized protein LOC129218214 [Uloborus diversus]|uniref:uncharacterized protein LOC129218214 n=1 Tax=Uloborus diversus TaxID=327109 RepID=UPI00240A6A9C|nr:uncharacterized protein LOC129218214 [Uloborus diversus]
MVTVIERVPTVINRQRGILKGRVTRIENFLNTVQLEEETEVQLTVKLEALKEILRDLKTLQTEVLGLPDNVDITENLQAFEEIEISIENAEVDKESSKQYQMSLKGKDVEGFDQLLEFFETRVSILETVSKNAQNKQPLKNLGPSSQKSKVFVVQNKNNKPRVCVLCKNNHTLFWCVGFHDMSASEKLKFVEQKGLCKNCLNAHVGICKSKYVCSVCKDKHNTLLHDSLDEVYHTAIVSDSEGRNLRNLSDSSQGSSTVSVGQQRKGNNRVEVTSLSDSCSDINLMTEKLADVLGLKKLLVKNLSLSGIGDHSVPIKYKVICCISNADRTFEKQIECFLVPQIAAKIPSKSFSINECQIPSHIVLACPNFFKSTDIKLLLNSSLFFEILRPEKLYSEDKKLIFQDSVFGYLCTNSTLQETDLINCYLTENSKLDTTLENFFEMESFPGDNIEPTKTEDEKFCEEHFVRTHSRDSTGRYIVKYPMRENAESLLGFSKLTAEKRLNSIWAKLNKNNTMEILYRDFLAEYLSLGHMEEVEDVEADEKPGRVYYIPHHPIFKPENKSTPLRVVFNASEKTSSGYSLNSILLFGGTIQQDLFSIVLRFRKHKIAFCGDIRKMYRQILVHESQRDLQRILWKDSCQAPVKIYRLTTVSYGICSAPFLATRVLQALADDEKSDFPITSDILRNDTYVDDILTGAASVDAAKQSLISLRNLLKRGGFELHKIISNSTSIMADEENAKL